MSKEQEANNRKDGALFNDEKAESVHSNSPPSSPASSAGGRSIQSASPVGALSVNGIVEVSDKEEEEDDTVLLPRRETLLSLRCVRPHVATQLMVCGHPAPPIDPNRVKAWAGNGKSWCSNCNPITSKNLIRTSVERSGWRRTMETLIDKNALPLSVLNINDTFVYTGNAGVDSNILATSSDCAVPFMLDLDMFLGIVCTDDLARLPLRAFMGLRAFIQSDTRVVPFFSKLHPQTLCHFSVNLIETAIRLMDEPTEHSEIAFRRSRTALQCFYNTASRVPIFRDTIAKHQLTHWLNLLRIEYLRCDMILCVLAVIRELHYWFFRQDDLYVRLLSDMAVLWGSPAVITEHRAFILNIFVVLFDSDPTFLCDSFKVVERDVFSEFLVILESSLNFAPVCRLRDYEISNPKMALHPDNLAFCLELLELLDKELNEGRPLRYDVTVRLTMLVDIINICASSRDVYHNVLHRQQKAISLMCGVLKALMFAQRELGILYSRTQSLANNSQRTQAVQRVRSDMSTKRSASESLVHLTNDENELKAENETNGSLKQKRFLQNHDANRRSSTQTPKSKREDTRAPLSEHIEPEAKELSDNVEQTGEMDVARRRLAANSPVRKVPRMETTDVEAPLLSPTSGKSESPVANQRLNRSPQRVAKVAPVTVDAKTNNCYEEITDEDDEVTDEFEDDDDDLDEDDEVESAPQLIEGLFGPRAEILFGEYMSERSPEFSSESLREDELLVGLPHFTAIQQIYQMVITRNIPLHLFSSLRQSTLRAISNLCKDSPKNQIVAGHLEAIPLVLQCSMRHESERPVVLQLAVVTLKSLCINCPENQNRLIDITEGCRQFLDRQRLFAIMGMRLTVGENGKAILVPVENAIPVATLDE